MNRKPLQEIFVLAGIALVITGLNNSRALVVVGLGLITLAVVGRVMGPRGD